MCSPFATRRFLALLPLAVGVACVATASDGSDGTVGAGVVDSRPAGTPADTLTERFARTLVGTIGERAVAIELRLEDGRVTGWVRPLDPPGEVLNGGPWFTGAVEPDGTLALEEHDQELVARIEGRLEIEGGRLVLEGERRPLDDDEIRTVSLEERGLALGAGARLVSRDVLVHDTTRAVAFYAEAPRVVGEGGDPPATPAMRRLDAALEERVATDREWFLDSFGVTQPDSVQERITREWGPSWYESSYDAWVTVDSVLSVEATVSTYGAGAAHPNHHTWTLVWNLEGGVEVELDDLFRRGSGWLDTLSQRAVTILSEERLDMSDEWLRSGAGPERDNFSAWTVVPAGIRIVFDPYQVASYAAGPQVVDIPWAALDEILATGGPVAIPTSGRLPSGAATGRIAGLLGDRSTMTHEHDDAREGSQHP